ncbi:MAG: AtpZ/AtpI family protein [Oscillospiraceae bacterium]|nr:AtpZ/AtpI family protein [Oscillospiraceae bacterium]
MKHLSLIMWVTQFGVSLVFPLFVFLWLGHWLQNEFGFGIWIMAVCGIIGFLTSVSTAKSCWKSMRKAAEELSQRDEPPTVAFNDHS